MNDIKAFVADIGFLIIAKAGLGSQGIELTDIIIRLLVLVSSNTHIITDDLQKCVLKAMLIVSPKGTASKKQILDIFCEDFLCPHEIKRCSKLNNRLSSINCTIRKLVESKVIIPESDDKEDDTVYRISNFIEKNGA